MPRFSGGRWDHVYTRDLGRYKAALVGLGRSTGSRRLMGLNGLVEAIWLLEKIGGVRVDIASFIYHWRRVTRFLDKPPYDFSPTRVLLRLLWW